MYNGYVESPEKIAERKARILKGYKPAKKATLAPARSAGEKLGGRKPSGSLGG